MIDFRFGGTTQSQILDLGRHPRPAPRNVMLKAESILASPLIVGAARQATQFFTPRLSRDLIVRPAELDYEPKSTHRETGTGVAAYRD